MHEMTVGCKQIVDYMKKAGFYKLFGERLLRSLHGVSYSRTLEGRKALLGELLGALGVNTLIDTFTWEYTPEGSIFWSERYNRLRDAFSKVSLKYKKVIRQDL